MKFYPILFVVFCRVSLYAQPDHGIWNDFLKTHVSSSGNVNYKSIQNSSKDLETYIATLQESTPTENWSRQEKLAYWINAYNALTIDLIIRNYPINSIKDIKRPWDQRIWQFGETPYSLNEIEHRILRTMNEPRIHFAIVCASVSCPKLQNEAFNAEKLEVQLNKATQAFLNDASKNKISTNSLELSKIFRWFAKDFTFEGGVVNFINKRTEVDISPNAKISYLDYNWDLNE
jgi:hypothetical protein